MGRTIPFPLWQKQWDSLANAHPGMHVHSVRDNLGKGRTIFGAPGRLQASLSKEFPVSMRGPMPLRKERIVVPSIEPYLSSQRPQVKLISDPAMEHLKDVGLSFFGGPHCLVGKPKRKPKSLFFWGGETPMSPKQLPTASEFCPVGM